MAEFKVGDRVRVIKEDFECIVGEEGTVVEIRDTGIGVSFDRVSSDKHTCNGFCEDGHGWYIMRENIELVSEVKPLPEKYAVHTKTQEEADYLFECGAFLPDSVASWTSPHWEVNKEESAYCVVGNNLMGFADIGFYEERTDRYGEIIEFDEWLTRIGLNDNKINTKETLMSEIFAKKEAK